MRDKFPMYKYLFIVVVVVYIKTRDYCVLGVFTLILDRYFWYSSFFLQNVRGNDLLMVLSLSNHIIESTLRFFTFDI
jgi:hypothetical protein